MIKRGSLLAGIVAGILFFGGSAAYAHETAYSKASSESIHNINYTIIEEEQIPESLEAWVSRSLERSLIQTKVLDDVTYILITRGMKSSGGYGIEITSLVRDEINHKLQVVYQLIDPGKHDLVTEELTYPSVLLRVEEPFQAGIQFEEVNNRDIAQLDGSSFLPEIMKGTNNILLLPPKHKQQKIYVQGFVRGFEGIVNYQLIDEEGNVRWKNALSATKAEPKWGKIEHALPDQWDASSELQVSVQLADSQQQVYKEQITVPIEEIQKYLGRLSLDIKQ